MDFKKQLTLLFLGTLLLSLAIPASGVAVLGSLNGHVTTTNGRAVSGATVTVSYDSNGTSVTTLTTDANGYYSTRLIMGNQYRVVASKVGVGTSLELGPFGVNPMSAITKDLAIRSLPAHISVSSSKPSINADDSDYTTISTKVTDVYGDTPAVTGFVDYTIDKSPWSSHNDGSLSSSTSISDVPKREIVFIAPGTNIYYGWVSPAAPSSSVIIRALLHKSMSETVDSGAITVSINKVSTPTPSPPVEKVNADYAASPTSGPAPLTVHFTDKSTGGPMTYINWSFGDGYYSNEANPTHTYTEPGEYITALSLSNFNSATGSGSSDLAWGLVYIHVTAPAGQSNNGGNTPIPPPPDVQSGSPTPSPVVVPPDDSATDYSNIGDDTMPPVTVATLSGTSANGTDAYISDVQVILLANDGTGSGIQWTQYSLDGTSWYRYESPFTVSKDGSNTVFYHSIDNANNTEATHVKSFTITHPAKAQYNLPCLNMLVLPLLIVGVLAIGVTKRKKGGK